MQTTHHTITLSFDGYWREPNAGGVPAASGVYVVYAGTYNVINKTVSLDRVLYIGESQDVRARIAQHLAGGTGQAWKRKLRVGELLCFSCAPIAGPDRLRAEAAMIFRHKPPTNTEYVNHFPSEWSPTSITTNGKNALLANIFTVP